MENRGEKIRRRLGEKDDDIQHLGKEIFMYGMEIWGWEKRKKLKALQVKYIRWTLELDRCITKYIIQKETKVEWKISIDAKQRAIKYQEKIKTTTENKILKECRRENQIETHKMGKGDEKSSRRMGPHSGKEKQRRRRGRTH